MTEDLPEEEDIEGRWPKDGDRLFVEAPWAFAGNIVRDPAERAYRLPMGYKRAGEGTIWLSQAQIAELFQTTPQNVTLHLKAIYAEGELLEGATCKEYLQVRQEQWMEYAASSGTHPLD